MRILVITDTLWRNDNGVGNSYSNIFGGLPEAEIFHICCQEGRSDNSVTKACFQISESRLIQNRLNPSVPSGVLEISHKDPEPASSADSGVMRFVKRSRLQIFFWLRDLIWKFGRWKSAELIKYLDEVHPDLIFAQLQDKKYLNTIVRFAAEYTGAPLALYAWDDVYSLRQFSISPLFWIDRLMQRASIRKLMKRAAILYTISKEQQEEYGRTLKASTKLLYKGYKFVEEPSYQSPNPPIKILYTGNLYSGRYKTVLKICKMLERYNKDRCSAQLEIYSASPLSASEIGALNIANTSSFQGKISETEVQQKQKQADILLHIEPMTLKGKLLCRLSFSTKLVDYFHNGKCIFAVGSDLCSSIRYLQRHQGAVVATDLSEAESKLKEILENPEMIEKYARLSWKCGAQNHEIDEIQKNLLRSLKEILHCENFMDR